MTSCGNCLNDYDESFPNVPLGCGHRACYKCIIHFNYGCQCKSLYDILGQYPSLFNELMRTVKTKEKEASKMRLEAQKAKQRMTKLEESLISQAQGKSNSVFCSICCSVDTEDRMNICTSCTKKLEKIEVKKGEKVVAKENVDINRLALCSTCIIKNHVGADHKIVQFYPVLAATEADNYLEKFVEFRKKMGETKDKLKESKDVLFKNLEKIDEKFQNMFDLVKRSKSSEATKQLIDVVENRYEKIQVINEVIGTSLETYAAESSENLKCFTEENKKLNEELCLEEIGKDDWELNISKMIDEEREDDIENQRNALAAINI